MSAIFSKTLTLQVSNRLFSQVLWGTISTFLFAAGTETAAILAEGK